MAEPQIREQRTSSRNRTPALRPTPGSSRSPSTSAAGKTMTIYEIARHALGIENQRIGTADQRRIAAMLERLGWARKGKELEGPHRMAANQT